MALQRNDAEKSDRLIAVSFYFSSCYYSEFREHPCIFYDVRAVEDIIKPRKHQVNGYKHLHTLFTQ